MALNFEMLHCTILLVTMTEVCFASGNSTAHFYHFVCCCFSQLFFFYTFHKSCVSLFFDLSKDFCLSPFKQSGIMAQVSKSAYA